MTFPINTNTAIAKAIVVFHAMHTVCYVMGNHALQFADKTREDLHLGNGHQFRLFQRADMPGNRGEVLIDAGKAVVRLQLSSQMFSLKMLSSQVSSYVSEIWSGIRQRDCVGGFRFQSHTVERKQSEVNSLSLVICGATC